MNVIDCEQGSREWHEARLGIPTASCFSRILTEKRLTLSAQRVRYMGELLWEWTSGEPYGGELDTEWMARGRDLEPRAREYYGVVRDVQPTRVGLCTRRVVALRPLKDGNVSVNGDVGASPDALVGDDGLNELKCPAPATHIVWLSAGADVLPGEHRMQVQGQLWVTGRAWCDFMSYCPGLPPLLVRVEPDPKVQAALSRGRCAAVFRIRARRAARVAARARGSVVAGPAGRARADHGRARPRGGGASVTVIGIDPGPEQSAFVRWDGTRVLGHDIAPNASCYAYLQHRRR